MSEIPRNANKLGVASMAMTTMSHDAIQIDRNDTSLGDLSAFSFRRFNTRWETRRRICGGCWGAP